MPEPLKHSKQNIVYGHDFSGRMPIRKPLKNREGQSMTIAIGILANDGFLIAADTEVNDGVTKTKQSKILTATKPLKAWNGNCSLIASGAGDREYLTLLIEKIAETFAVTMKDTDMTFDVIETSVGSIVQTFHDDHVYPMVPQATVSLIVGCQLPAGVINGELSFYSQLWRSTRSAFGKATEGSAVTGIGAAEFRNQLARVWPQTDDILLIKNLVPLVAYVLRHVKEVVPETGKETYMSCSLKGEPRVINPEYIRALETYFRLDVTGLERSAASYLFGDREPLNKVTAALKKAKKTISAMQGEMWLT